MENTEQAKKSESGISRRMNDFYFELKGPDGKVEVFEGKGEERKEGGLQN
jgi:hypothetical protein